MISLLHVETPRPHISRRRLCEEHDDLRGRVQFPTGGMAHNSAEPASRGKCCGRSGETPEPTVESGWEKGEAPPCARVGAAAYSAACRPRSGASGCGRCFGRPAAKLRG